MQRSFLLIMVLGIVFAITPAWAQHATVFQIEALQAENAQLRDRVDALEKALVEINAKLSAQPSAAAPVEPATPAAQAAPAKPAVPAKPVITSKYHIDLFGYLKLDMAWDKARSDTGNFARWALSESAVAPDDRQFSQTINQTRFGFNVKGPNAGKANVSGQYEVDLYGGGAENSAMVRTRHAFFQVDWPEDVSLLMGQTWDLIGPQNPNTLDYTVAWQAGNIGFRHPQLRLGKGFKAGDGKILVQIAASRKVGDATTFSNSPDTGADSGSPAFQGRIGYTFPTSEGQKGTIGVWGHSGNDEYDYNAAGDNVSVKSSSKGIDLNIALDRRFAFKGELWEGRNLDEYQGGVGNGIIVTSASGTFFNNAAFGGRFFNAEPLESKGGWFEFNVGPFQKWRYNLGMSVDNPDDELLPNANNASRARNRSRWINALYDLNEAVQMGLEYMRIETVYKNRLDGDDTRLQSSFIYKF